MLRLRESGYTWEQCFDFDRGFVRFTWWLDRKKDERIWVAPDKGHEGKVPVPKYRDITAILALYDTDADPDLRFVREGMLMDTTELTEIIAAMADGPSF